MTTVHDDCKLQYSHYVPGSLYALDNTSEETEQYSNVLSDAKTIVQLHAKTTLSERQENYQWRRNI